MYCTNVNDWDCQNNNTIRLGYQQKDFKLEELFHKHGIDVIMNGHKHDYERTHPIYNYTYEKSAIFYEYKDAKYPIHIISGSAGKKEWAKFMEPAPQWSAFRSTERGFTILRVQDRLNLGFMYWSVENNRTVNPVIDRFWLIKTRAVRKDLNPDVTTNLTSISTAAPEAKPNQAMKRNNLLVSAILESMI